jgi:hypothetical protein
MKGSYAALPAACKVGQSNCAKPGTIAVRSFALRRKIATIATSKELWSLVWMGVALLICRWIGSLVLPVYDDAFVTFRYSRNLAMGNGFVYHPGEWVLGTTSPGFGLLVSLFYVLGLPMPQMVVVMNIVLDAVVFCITLCTVPKKERQAFGAILGALLAISPIMTRISVGGMEMNLYLVGCVLSILLYLRQFKRSAVILAAICYFLRPEALVLLGLLCAIEWFSGKRSNAFRLGLFASMVLVVPLILIFSFYGQVLPQSVIAKSDLARPPLLDMLRQLLAPDPLMALLIPSATWGFIVSFRRVGFSKIVGVWGVIYLAIYIVAQPKIWSWYGEPIYYAIMLLATLGGMDLMARWPRLRQAFTPKWICPLIAGLCVAVWMFVWLKLGPSAVTQHVYEPVKAWCRDNTRENTSILAYDIGVIGYYSNARIYDLAGLVWPVALSSTGNVIQTYWPDYLFLNATQSTVELMGSASFDKLYQPVAQFSRANLPVWGASVEHYSADWVQDYIMFRKQSVEHGQD